MMKSTLEVESTKNPLRRDLMEADLIPTVWLAVGPKGTKQALTCFKYREWKKMETVGEGGPNEGSSPAAQAMRWREWLVKREPGPCLIAGRRSGYLGTLI